MPLTKVPGHDACDSSEHVTVTPVVAVIFATGPVTVVENFDAIVRQVAYAENVFNLLDFR
jgi:hypothetical protein